MGVLMIRALLFGVYIKVPDFFKTRTTMSFEAHSRYLLL